MIQQGWRLQRSHDLVELLQEASGHNGTLAQFEEAFRLIGEYYFTSRYPMHSPQDFTEEQIRLDIVEVRSFLNVLGLFQE